MEFERKKRLGSGAFGEVWLVLDRALGKERAVKYVPRERLVDPDNFFHESQILGSLQHANIIKAEAAGTDGDQLFIAMEYIAGGSVETHSSGAPVAMRSALRIMGDVLRGLQYAHEHEVLHRDIKPANVLLRDDGTALLTDFGLATKLEGGLPGSPRGYVYHVAPETLVQGVTDARSDIYGAGVTLYRLVNGDDGLPALGAGYQDAIVAGTFPPRDGYRMFVPTAMKRIVNKAIHPNPNERFQTADEFRHALESIAITHDWVEQPTGRGTEWAASLNPGEARVVLRQERSGRWSVDVLRGLRAEPRRLNSESISQVPKLVARRHAAAVLRKMNRD